MDDRDKILTDIRQFVEDNFLYMRPGFALRDDDSLLRKGVMDSLGVMEVVGFVEEHWDMTIDPSEITEDRFGSIAALARFVTERTNAGSSATTG